MKDLKSVSREKMPEVKSTVAEHVLEEAEMAAEYYYAVLNENDVVVSVQSLPVPVTADNLIAIDSFDESLIGKWYNRATGQFEDKMFFYAVLDDKDIVIDVVAVPSEVTADNMISISTLDRSLIGKWYNRATGEFGEVPIHVLAVANTGEINTLNSDGTPKDEWLDTKLREIEEKVKFQNEQLSAQIAQNSAMIKDLEYGQGGYIAKFRMRNTDTTTTEYISGKRLTFEFDSGIAGYLPKKIRLAGDGDFVCDLYCLKNPDGTIKDFSADSEYLAFNKTASTTETSNWHVSCDADSFYTWTTNATAYHDYGGSRFIDPKKTTANAKADIENFAYDDHSISFDIIISSQMVGARLNVDFDAYIY